MNRIKTSEDEGLGFKDEPVPQLKDLLTFLESSSLVGRYTLNFPVPPPQAATSNDIKNICKALEQLLLEDLTFDELTALFVASSITYLMSRSFQDFESRTELLHRTFRYTSTLDPVKLHIAAKRLHENLKTNSNLLFLCKTICFSSDMGNALAMCLLWAMLLDTLGKEIEMYCFHPFSLINELLADVDLKKMLNGQESSLKAYFALQLIAILISSIISVSNDELKKAGYFQYFRYDLKDIHMLRDWAREINKDVSVTAKHCNTNYDLSMAIEETIIFEIVLPLEDKLRAIDGGLENSH